VQFAIFENTAGRFNVLKASLSTLLMLKSLEDEGEEERSNNNMIIDDGNNNKYVSSKRVIE